METLLFSFGIIMLICGISTILNNALYEGLPHLYSKEDLKYIKPLKNGSIISMIGLYFIGPSIIAGIIFLIIFPICYFISRKRRV